MRTEVRDETDYGPDGAQKGVAAKTVPEGLAFGCVLLVIVYQFDVVGVGSQVIQRG